MTRPWPELDRSASRGEKYVQLCNFVFQSLAALLLKLFQPFGVCYHRGEWNGRRMWLSSTLKISTALHTEILERGRAHDAANPESGNVTTCGQIRFEKFWACLRNKCGDLRRNSISLTVQIEWLKALNTKRLAQNLK